MAKSTKKEKNLQDLLISKLSVLYDVEKQLVKALPKLAKAAGDIELIEGFENHLKETKNHVKRLEQTFALLKAKLQKSLTSAAIRGIIEDGSWVMKNIQPQEALDSNLIAAASYAEHYEMAGYKTAIEWAAKLGHLKVVELLTDTLIEEISADEKLAILADQKIDDKAL